MGLNCRSPTGLGKTQASLKRHTENPTFQNWLPKLLVVSWHLEEVDTDILHMILVFMFLKQNAMQNYRIHKHKPVFKIELLNTYYNDDAN